MNMVEEIKAPLFTNNARKMAGRPLRRKKDKRKRFYTRHVADEDFSAWYEWISGGKERNESKGAARNFDSSGSNQNL